ncbi:FecR protein [Leptolyngbyaceae cyanobacterium JSC-12]|nr:FecR protein [Leptolyngbyaceae cyanobacterium JSC-12]
MASRSLLALVSSLLLSAGVTVVPLSASAETLLTKATIQKLRNQVELHLKQKRAPKKAEKADVMTPGDALRTFQRAMAELRFNDNSLARVGEQAVFYFEPNTRNFQLESGTVLLLVQPGQGRTRIRTPNAAAGIRGSALVVRYLKDTKVTMVAALTNSDIEISNKDGKTVVLKAGQIGYVYQDKIGVYNFDQKQFQETSPLFKEIDWNEAPIAVKEEIEAALSNQPTFSGKYDDTPLWTKLAENRSTPPQSNFVSTNRLEGDQFPTGTPYTGVIVVNQPQSPTSSGVQPETGGNTSFRPDPIAPSVSTQAPTASTARPEPVINSSPAPVIPSTTGATPGNAQPVVPNQPVPSQPVPNQPVPNQPAQTTPATGQVPSATSPPTRPVPSPTQVTPTPTAPTSVTTAPPTTTTPAVPATTPSAPSTPVSTTPVTPVPATPPAATPVTPVNTTPTVTPPATTTPVTPATPSRTEPVITQTPTPVTPPVQATPAVTPVAAPVVNSSPVPVTPTPSSAPVTSSPATVSSPVVTPPTTAQTPTSVSTGPATSPLDLPTTQPAPTTSTNSTSTTTTTAPTTR